MGVVGVGDWGAARVWRGGRAQLPPPRLAPPLMLPPDPPDTLPPHTRARLGAVVDGQHNLIAASLLEGLGEEAQRARLAGGRVGRGGGSSRCGAEQPPPAPPPAPSAPHLDLVADHGLVGCGQGVRDGGGGRRASVERRAGGRRPVPTTAATSRAPCSRRPPTVQGAEPPAPRHRASSPPRAHQSPRSVWAPSASAAAAACHTPPPAPGPWALCGLGGRRSRAVAERGGVGVARGGDRAIVAWRPGHTLTRTSTQTSGAQWRSRGGEARRRAASI